MFKNIPFFPPQASSLAGEVDLLFFYQVGFTIFFSLLVAFLFFFARRFRRRCNLPSTLSFGLEFILTSSWAECRR